MSTCVEPEVWSLDFFCIHCFFDQWLIVDLDIFKYSKSMEANNEIVFKETRRDNYMHLRQGCPCNSFWPKNVVIIEETNELILEVLDFGNSKWILTKTQGQPMGQLMTNKCHIIVYRNTLSIAALFICMDLSTPAHQLDPWNILNWLEAKRSIYNQ
jgi:hypothetical protein